MSLNIEQIVPARKSVELSALQVWNNYSYPLEVFDDRLIEFFDRFSKAILKDKQINRLPEITALAFWLRKSNLAKLKEEHSYWKTDTRVQIQPLGKVFHVCPANVDTMFLYSLAISWLCGNMNIVRVSKRAETAAVQHLFDHLNAMLQEKEFEMFAPYVHIISYDHNASINEFICTRVNGRILWGGDKTIETFKSFKTTPRIKDICFADRLSFTLIKSATWLGLSDEAKNENLVKLYNDSFMFDQMGCASPQTLCFYGNQKNNTQCREEVYSQLSSIVNNRYEEDRSSLAALKLNRLADDTITGEVRQIQFENTGLVFATTAQTEINHKSCGGGFFYVSEIEKLASLTSLITHRHQTLSYIGLDPNDIQSIVNLSRGRGIDRVVPVGLALDFNNYWDGYKLTEELITRKYVI